MGEEQKRWRVKIRATEERDGLVYAVDEDQARNKAIDGEVLEDGVCGECSRGEGDLVGWEVVSVEEDRW